MNPKRRALQLLQTGAPRRALCEMLGVLEHNPTDPAAWILASRAMIALGQHDDAEAALREAAKVGPQDAGIHLELGAFLAQRGVREEPERCFRRAIDLNPALLEARVRLGNTCLNHGDLDGAGAAFTGVLMQDRHHSGAVSGAALVLQHRGAHPEAYALLRDHLASHTPTVPMGLTWSRACVDAGVPGEALPALRALLKGSLVDHDRALLQHALGEVYDALDLTDEAFRAWERGNALRGLRFDGAQHLRTVEGMIRATQHIPEGTCEDERPVLIVGTPRSGTSLLESLLGGHSEIGVAGELEVLRDLARAVPKALHEEGTWMHHIHRLPELRDELADHYLQTLSAAAGGGRRWIDKMPNNALHLGLLGAILPKAHVVWCVRDRRDVALSLFRQVLGAGLPWATSMQGIQAWQEGIQRLMHHWSLVIPNTIHVVVYEELVTEPAATLRWLVEGIGLPWEAGVLRGNLGGTQVRTASWRQVQEPIHPRSVGRSHRYRAWIRQGLGGT